MDWDTEDPAERVRRRTGCLLAVVAVAAVVGGLLLWLAFSDATGDLRRQERELEQPS